MNQSIAQKEAARVTLVGMWADLLLGGAKMLGGTLTGSFALVSDGIHSLTDAASDIFVLIVTRFSNEAPDREHPYGHGRFEAIGTILMGMLFFAIAAVLIYDSILRLRSGQDLPVPGWGGLVIAGISIATKEWIYHYTMRTAARLNSSLLRANAWHSRTDAISSIAVGIGIFGAQQGYPWLDVVAAMFVALIIARVGWELCLESLKELVDTAIPDHHQDKIEKEILNVPGVQQVTNLRSRLSGGKILLEAQIQVNPRITVSEGHQLGTAVSQNIQDKYKNISDVVVHIDAESHADDLHRLPLRDELVAEIEAYLQPFFKHDDIINIDLHYLENGIEVVLTVAAKSIDGSREEEMLDALQALSVVRKLTIFSVICDREITRKPT